MSKISRKMYLLLVLSIGLSVTISSWFITAYLLIQSEKDQNQINKIHLEGLVDSIEQFFMHAVTLNHMLAINPNLVDTVVNSPDWEERSRLYTETYNVREGVAPDSGFPLLAQTHLDYSFIELLFLQDAAGDQTARSFGPLGRRKERWWYKKIAGEEDYWPFISHSYYSLTGQKPVASIFHPVFQGEDFAGILGMDINFNHLQRLTASYLNSDEMYAIVVDMNGVIIAHPEEDKIREIYNLVNMTRSILPDNNASDLNAEGYLDLEEFPLDWPGNVADVVKLAIDGEIGMLRDAELEGELCNIFYAPVVLDTAGNTDQNYAVLLVRNKGSMIRTRNIILIWVTLFAMIIILILIFIFSREYNKNILIPLNRLICSMSEESEGAGFKEIVMDTGDEFYVLAGAYNDLRKKLDTANLSLQEKLSILEQSEEGYKAFAQIGLSLSTEKDIEKLMELILVNARSLTNADGGTLYLFNRENQSLDFSILYTESMNFHMGGTSGNPVTLPPVPLYDQEGNPNYGNVSSCAALRGEIINIPDVYSAENFDFRGTRVYDETNGYHSRSMLVVPMKNMEDDLIGVIQLINARSVDKVQVLPFNDIDESLLISLASQAAVALTNTELHKNLVQLFNAFIKSIASAIDQKSAFTGGHIRRVVTLTMMIADEICRADSGDFRDIEFSEDQIEEIRISAWMHDIGKITTSEYVMDKQTKLQGFLDGIHVIETRYRCHMESLNPEGSGSDTTLSSKELAEELDFLQKCNVPREFLSDEDLDRLKDIRSRSSRKDRDFYPGITEEEFANLSIRKGSLNSEERLKMEEHAQVTKKLLQELPFPEHLKNVPDFAAMHHEKLNGSGYPDGLTGENIPLQARIIAVADIFEALTARDRPYRTAISFDRALGIMKSMVESGHIDGKILKLMIESGLIYRYAEKELSED